MLNKEAIVNFIQEHKLGRRAVLILPSAIALSLLPACASQPRSINQPETNFSGIADTYRRGSGPLGISFTCSQGDNFPQGIKDKHIDIDINSTELDPRPANHMGEGIFLFITDITSGGQTKQVGYEDNSPIIRGSFHGQTLGTEFINGKAYRFEARLARQTANDPRSEGRLLASQIAWVDCVTGKQGISIS